jgi:ADP-ribose pyrophosphatase YjhB (NUDIX family)
MHIGRHIVQELVFTFGEPEVERWDVPMTEEELDAVERHRSLGRAHDVSLVIQDRDRIAVIRKSGYPRGAYRIPSGGIHPEESFLDGAVREALEETGLSVRIEDYLLQVLATFVSGLRPSASALRASAGPRRSASREGGSGSGQARRSSAEAAGERLARWTTHVMLARPFEGALVPRDTAEIEEARWIGWRELSDEVNPLLLESGLGGLAYRARLHDRVRAILLRKNRAQAES